MIRTSFSAFVLSAAVVSTAFAGAETKDQKPVAGPPAAAACANPNGIGLARTVEIDTTGGPAFGFEQYKVYDFLEPKEVVLTFDDGPQVNTTKAIVEALGQHCTKATFFSIGKMALGMPEIIRDVLKAGHTVGTHTWSHTDLRAKKEPQQAIDEIELGVSAVSRAVGTPIAPFFRFPFLADSAPTMTHLSGRNIAVFSMDVDSFDFKNRSADKVVKTVMEKLEKKGKGIVLMHDIHAHTAKAVPLLLTALKDAGYKVVHLKPKGKVQTLADFDAKVEKNVKGLPAAGTEKPLTSVIKTVPNE